MFLLYIYIYKCIPQTILHGDLWPTVGHLVHIIATQGGCDGNNGSPSECHQAIFPTTLLVSPSIPQCHPSTRDDI